MAVQAEFIAHCAELLSGIGRVRTTRMFGGCGLYVDDIFIALIYQGIQETPVVGVEISSEFASPE